MSKFHLGLLLIFISALLVSFCFVGSYYDPDLYWWYPIVLISLTVIGVFCALYGSFLIGCKLAEKMGKFRFGLLLIFISVLLGSLFLIRVYHCLYWSHPIVFISVTIIGVSSALYGSFVAGNNLPKSSKRKGLFLPCLLIGLGALITLAGGLTGLAAIILAFGIAIGTGYWGDASCWEYGYGYNGDWMVMGFQLAAFFLSIFAGIIGGFLLGFGVKKLPEEKIISHVLRAQEPEAGLRNSVTSLALGITSMILALGCPLWIPMLFASLPIALVGLFFGALGLKSKVKRRNLAVAGIVVCSLALAGSLYLCVGGTPYPFLFYLK